MKRLFTFLIAVILISSLAGCAPIIRMIKPGRKGRRGIGVPLIAPYSGPEAKVKVADFDIKTAKAEGQAGEALREMLVAALASSDRFIVVAPGPLKPSRVKEGREDFLGIQSEDNQAQIKSEDVTPDLVIAITVADFEPKASGGRAGIGGGGGAASGILGGMLGTTLSKAQIVLDIHLLDQKTSRVLTAGSIQGQAGDIIGVSAEGFFGEWPLSPGLSAYADTSMEKAIRLCIIEVVRYLSENIPEEYYKY